MERSCCVDIGRGAGSTERGIVVCPRWAVATKWNGIHSHLIGGVASETHCEKHSLLVDKRDQQYCKYLLLPLIVSGPIVTLFGKLNEIELA